ncbi:MAG: hypothetical protein JW937_01460 [Candidatus Omnitrophica bacterium]|nr:hypothetical protein [Candidatus Omnitrophota bacterium]
MKARVWMSVVFGLAFVLSQAGPVFAGDVATVSFSKDSPASEWVQGMDYGDQAWGKLGFGIKNLFLGWTSIIRDTEAAGDAGDNRAWGFTKGVGNGILTMVGGLAHAVTFPITKLDVSLPHGGVLTD